MQLPEKSLSKLNLLVESLTSELGDNLYSCVLYGSAIRGDFIPVSSDVNLLIVLNESVPEAHTAIKKIIQSRLKIDPFIIGRVGMDRSLRAFALKFLSIQRDYKVLHGQDPLAGFEVDRTTKHFLCEQALRNVRLRLVRGYIVFGHQRRRYTEFLVSWIPTVFIDLSEGLRLVDIDVPHDFEERIPILAKEYGIDASILDDLLHLKQRPNLFLLGKRLSASQVADMHARIFDLLTSVILWIESTWENQNLVTEAGQVEPAK